MTSPQSLLKDTHTIGIWNQCLCTFVGKLYGFPFAHCLSITGGKKDQWWAGKEERNLPVFVAIPVKTGSSELPIFKVKWEKSSGMIGTIKREILDSLYTL